MADLVLKDRDGTAITYNGVEVVSIPNTEGELEHFLNLETGGIPSGGTDGQVLKKLSETDYDVGWENEVDITGKADKVTGGTADNFASLDANGNLKDSGKKATDFEVADETILKQADVVDDLTTGGVNVPLSAEQGKLIKASVDAHTTADNPHNITADTVGLGTAREDIAIVKKDIKDLTQTIQQSNLSGEDKISTEGYGTLSLPKNATGYCGVELNGNTLDNLIVNGDFSNGTAGWSTLSSAISVNNKVLSATASGTSEYPGVRRPDNIFKTNEKIYARATVRVTNSDCTNIRLRIVAGYTDVNQIPLQNQWYALSGIATVLTDITTPTISISHQYADATTANGKVMEIQEVMAINLTAHGLDTLTVEQCDLMTDMYFEGTQSAMVSRVTSVGKNLFDQETILPTQGFIKQSDGSYYVPYASTPYNKVLYSNTENYTGQYKIISTYKYLNTVTQLAGSIIIVKYTDGTESVSTATYNVNFITNSFTTNSSKVVDKITWLYDTGSTQTWVKDITITKDINITTYEPYRKQEQYIKPYPLYRLPNGTCNTIVNGVYTQRVGKVDLGTLSWSYISEYSSFIVNNTTYIKDWTTGLLVSNGKYTVHNTMTSGNNLTMAQGTNIFRIRDDSFNGNIAEFKASVTGVYLYYELDVQIIDYNIATGILNANPNGTIYFDNGFADAGVYSDGITILNTDYPIVTLEKLLILNADGSHTDLDVSTATIALDGKSFTHAGLTNGDIVAFTYKGADSPLKGKNKITYLDSKNVIADTTNGKFYKLKPKITNGVVQPVADWTPVEV